LTYERRALFSDSYFSADDSKDLILWVNDLTGVWKALSGESARHSEAIM